MIDVVRLTLGNGQSYENVSILTALELTSSVNMVFADSTFAFIQHTSQDNKFILSHAMNILVIHLSKTIAPVLTDSIAFEKVVLSHDAIYGPGRFYLPYQHSVFGLEPFVLTDVDFIPFLFSTKSEGLFLVNSQNIASLECKAAHNVSSPRLMPQRLMLHRLEQLPLRLRRRKLV